MQLFSWFSSSNLKRDLEHLFLLRIKRIHRMQSVVPGSNEDLSPGQPETRISVGYGPEYPIQPEKGRISLEVELLGGNWPEVAETAWLIAGQSALACTIRKQSNSTQADLFFGQIFLNGFEHSLRLMLSPRQNYIIGMASTTATFRDIALQKELGFTLCDVLLKGKLPPKEKFWRVGYALTLDSTDKAGWLGGAAPVSPGPQWQHIVTVFTDALGADWEQLSPVKHSCLSLFLDGPRLQEDWDGYGIPAKAIFHDLPVSVPSDGIAFGLEKRMEPVPDNHSLAALLQLDQKEAYSAFYEIYNEILDWEQTPVCRWLGFPNAIQECVTYEVLHALNEDASPSKAAKWLLLFQLDPYALSVSIPNLGTQSIYFLIHENDLKSGNLENIKVVLQDT